jgi:hypothetical protein
MSLTLLATWLVDPVDDDGAEVAGIAVGSSSSFEHPETANSSTRAMRDTAAIRERCPLRAVLFFDNPFIKLPLSCSDIDAAKLLVDVQPNPPN